MNSHKSKVSTLLLYAMTILHVAYFILFTIENVKPLEWLNAILVISYLKLAVNSKSGQSVKRFIGCFITTSVCVIVHYCLLGPNFGFQYLGVCILPIIFYFIYVNNQKIVFAKNISICIFCMFFILILACTFIEYPLRFIEVSPVVERIVLCVNVICSFTFAIKFMLAFVGKVIEDTGALENLTVDLENKANVDALTGVRNRRTVENYIEKELHLAAAEGKDFAMFMCDIDDFKKVNDTYGHDCGDQVLRNIASIIVGEIRPSDAIFRWGGEEFLLVINAKGSVANKVAERCRKAIEDSSVIYNDVEIKVTITIGGVVNYQGATRDELINKADENLYKGKQNGKNQVVMIC